MFVNLNESSTQTPATPTVAQALQSVLRVPVTASTFAAALAARFRRGTDGVVRFTGDEMPMRPNAATPRAGSFQVPAQTLLDKALDLLDTVDTPAADQEEFDSIRSVVGSELRGLYDVFAAGGPQPRGDRAFETLLGSAVGDSIGDPCDAGGLVGRLRAMSEKDTPLLTVNDQQKRAPLWSFIGCVLTLRAHWNVLGNDAVCDTDLAKLSGDVLDAVACYRQSVDVLDAALRSHFCDVQIDATLVDATPPIMLGDLVRWLQAFGDQAHAVAGVGVRGIALVRPAATQLSDFVGHIAAAVTVPKEAADAVAAAAGAIKTDLDLIADVAGGTSPQPDPRGIGDVSDGTSVHVDPSLKQARLAIRVGRVLVPVSADGTIQGQLPPGQYHLEITTPDGGFARTLIKIQK